MAGSALAQQTAPPNSWVEELVSAVVQIKTHINPEGRTVEGLGREREGSGIVIDTDGLILINLGAVTFIDSSGVNALSTAREEAGPRLRVGATHPAIRRVLEITAMPDMLAASDDLSSR